MPARTLLLIRHAKSDWAAGAPDHERPLNARGRREAPALGRRLAELGLRPDLVVCSDATRAQQTWALAAAVWPDRPPVLVEPRLYDASRSEVLDVITGTSPDVHVLACVGHEPTTSALASVLADTDSDPAVVRDLAAGLKTACAVVLEVGHTWQRLEVGGARMTAIVSPR
jgi:phosphohistidine phosphatase